MMFAFSFAIIVLFILSGAFYHKGSIRVYENLLTHKQYARKDLAMRVVFPTTYNLFSFVLFPVIIVVISVYGLNGIIPQIAIFTGVANFSWEIIRYFEQFYYAKHNIGKTNLFLKELTSNNVVNEAGYKKQVDLTQTTEEILHQSKTNKSLILKDFIPKYITNGKDTHRKFTIELKPGLYQVNGINGIGKTTILESITLTEEELVELSYGQAAFHGHNLFQRHKTLKEHRQKYKYIGRYSSQYKLTKRTVKKFEKYPIIFTFLDRLRKEPKQKYSEGEKAIVAICYNLSEIKASSILVIDELISRVYEDKHTPLRSNILKIVHHFAYQNGHIVFIVDHVIKIPDAIQLRLTEKRISVDKDVS